MRRHRDISASMPTLRNPRHEAYAQLIAQAPKRGMSNAQCYREAGYRVDAGPACDVAASRLLSSDKVRARIDELIAPTIKRTRATVDSLAEQFDRVFDGAVSAEQYGAASNAAGLKAKLLGFMRTQIEIGAPGEFGGCQTTEDVVAALLSDQTPAEALASLALLQQEIEAYAANNAALIPAAKPARRQPNELALSLQHHRRRR
jgi:hypothetical protein